MVSSRTSIRSKHREGSFYRDRILAHPANHTNVEHWNRVLNTCYNYLSARSWIDYMRYVGVVTPNLFTYNKLLQRTETCEQALAVLQEMRDHHVGEDAWTTNIIINKWITTFEGAYTLFCSMRCNPNLVTYQVLSDKATTVQQMYKVMDHMNASDYDYNYRIWHNLLRVADRRTEAQRFYNIMQRCGVHPSAKTRAIMRKWGSS